MTHISPEARERLAKQYTVASKHLPQKIRDGTYEQDTYRHGSPGRDICNALSAIQEVLDERDALKSQKWDVKHTDAMNDMVAIGMARDAAISERDAARNDLLLAAKAVATIAQEREALRKALDCVKTDFDTAAGENEALRSRVRELEGAINTHFEALDRHDKSNDGFGKSRETYAEVMGTLADLRRTATKTMEAK